MNNTEAKNKAATKPVAARQAALKALLRAEHDGAYITLAAPAEALACADERDRRLAVALAYGTVERSVTIDYAAGRLLRKSIRDLAPHTRALLRLALYQLMYMTRLPAYAVVSETVSMGKHAGERGLLNAVLRRAAADIPALLQPPPRERDELRHLSVRYAMPLPLVRLYVKELGVDRAEHILAAFLQEPALTLRINPLRTSREALAAALTAAGYAPVLSPLAPDAVLLRGSCVPEALPGFAEGCFFVQDISSQLAVRALAPRPDMRVLDVCACPGGKTFSALCLAEGRGEFYACDVHESKLSLLTDTAKRLGLKPTLVAARDATQAVPAEWGRFDAVICDVPCSGLGVVGKKPDLRHRSLERLNDLPPLQLSILESATAALRTGGRLLYATCTLLSCENRGVVDAFLSRHGEFSLESDRTFYPDIDQTDGFYYAVLTKHS